MNNLYYGLVDLVDSLWESQSQVMFSFEWIQFLKSELYNFCKENLEECLAILHKYHFPNIDREAKGDFCKEFCEFIQTYNDASSIEGFGIETFRQMLKYAGQNGDLTFLYDNEDDILVEEYYTLYLGRCYIYKKSKHIFDNEVVVQEKN